MRAVSWLLAGTASSAHTRRTLLQFVFLLLGVGLLVPWNAFISAKAYFESRLCRPENGDSSSLPPRNLMANFALIYNLSSVITLTLLLALQSLRDHRTALVTDREANDATNPATTNSVPLETCLEDDDPWNRSEAVNEHQNSIVSTARTTARSSDKVSSSHAFWLVQIPLSLYVLVFASQALWIWIRTLPHFLAWTRLGLVVCGVASGLAGAGLVASAGRYEASVAMSPYIAVRFWTGCSDGVMVVLCRHGERAFPLISSPFAHSLTRCRSRPRMRTQGQSLGGVAVSLANLAAAYGKDPSDYHKAHCESVWIADSAPACIPYEKVDTSMFVYFMLAIAIIVAGLIGFSCLERIGDPTTDYDAIDSDTSRDRDGGSSAAREDQPAERDGLMMTLPAIMAPSLSSDALANNCDGEVSSRLHAPNGIANQRGSAGSDASLVWSNVRSPAICIFMTLFVTLSLFPGWTSELQSIHQCRSAWRVANDLYVPYGFVLFNVGDLTGRLLSARFSFDESLGPNLVAASWLRCIFFPLLYYCRGGSNHDRIHVPSDVYSYTVQFAFAVSNGSLLSAAFGNAPTRIPAKPEMQQRMSKILSFAVAFGLLCGSFFAYPVTQLYVR
jgi:Nucleoside transporter